MRTSFNTLTLKKRKKSSLVKSDGLIRLALPSLILFYENNCRIQKAS